MSSKWYTQVYRESRELCRVGVIMKRFKDKVGTGCSPRRYLNKIELDKTYWLQWQRHWTSFLSHFPSSTACTLGGEFYVSTQRAKFQYNYRNWEIHSKVNLTFAHLLDTINTTWEKGKKDSGKNILNGAYLIIFH